MRCCCSQQRHGASYIRLQPLTPLVQEERSTTTHHRCWILEAVKGAQKTIEQRLCLHNHLSRRNRILPFKGSLLCGFPPSWFLGTACGLQRSTRHAGQVRHSTQPEHTLPYGTCNYMAYRLCPLRAVKLRCTWTWSARHPVAFQRCCHPCSEGCLVLRAVKSHAIHLSKPSYSPLCR